MKSPPIYKASSSTSCPVVQSAGSVCFPINPSSHSLHTMNDQSCTTEQCLCMDVSFSFQLIAETVSSYQTLNSAKGHPLDGKAINAINKFR